MEPNANPNGTAQLAALAQRFRDSYVPDFAPSVFHETPRLSSLLDALDPCQPQPDPLTRLIRPCSLLRPDQMVVLIDPLGTPERTVRTLLDDGSIVDLPQPRFIEHATLYEINIVQRAERVKPGGGREQPDPPKPAGPRPAPTDDRRVDGPQRPRPGEGTKGEPNRQVRPK